MSFIQWLGDWLRKVSTSVKSITTGTNSLTYTKHNNDTVTIPLTLESDLYVKKIGDTITGNINSLYGVDGIETVNQFSGEMAGNDLWAIRTGITGNPDLLGGTDSTTTDNGFLEIATADNGTEPIYIAQYEGDHMLPNSQGIRFYQRIRRATLLDEQGNTVFPGTVTAVSFNGNATSANRATNANYATRAETALKLGSVDVGSATQPIYLNDGVATACTYQLHKTVPSDAVFTDTVYIHPTYTARTGNPATDLTPAFGGTVTVSQVESDGTGHVTGMTDRTITIPATEASSSAAGLVTTGDQTWAGSKTIADSSDTGWYVTYGSGSSLQTMRFMIGNGHVNRGLWDNRLNKWVFHCDNSKCYVGGYSIEKSVPSNAEFTDTVTTVLTSGSGNAVTDITANNGQLSVTKGASFFPLPTLESGTLTPTSNIGSNYSDVKKYGNVGIFTLSAGTPITFSGWTKYHIFTSSIKPKSYTSGYIHNQNGTQGGAYLEMETDGKIYLHTTGGTMPTDNYWRGSLVFFTD